MDQRQSEPSATNAIDVAMAQTLFAALRTEMAKQVIGQNDFVEQLFLTILCREHSLLMGPAGTAKWLAIESLGRCCGLTTRRFRCSADLEVEDAPIAQLWGSSLLLVDNIGRLPSKIQNLVLQAMQERVVDLNGIRHEVANPFAIYAALDRDRETPAEEPNALDDCFLFQMDVPYPTYHEEYLIASVKSGVPSEQITPVLTSDQLSGWQNLVPQLEASSSVVHYAVRLVRATRVHEGENPDFVYEWVLQGAGPRAVHFLILAAKARASARGRAKVLHEDVRAMCLPVLRHRIVVNQNARENGIGPDRVIRRLLTEIPPQVVGDESILKPGESLTFHDWIPSGDGS